MLADVPRRGGRADVHREPRVPVVSNVTGAIAADLGDAGLLGRGTSATRSGSPTASARCAEPRCHEVRRAGPGRACCPRWSRSRRRTRIAVPALRADRDEARTLLAALAELHVDGGDVDWARRRRRRARASSCPPTRSSASVTGWRRRTSAATRPRSASPARRTACWARPWSWPAPTASCSPGCCRSTPRRGWREHRVARRILLPGARRSSSWPCARPTRWAATGSRSWSWRPRWCCRSTAASRSVRVDAADGAGAARPSTHDPRRPLGPARRWCAGRPVAPLPATRRSGRPPARGRSTTSARQRAAAGLAYGPPFQGLRAAWRPAARCSPRSPARRTPDRRVRPAPGAARRGAARGLGARPTGGRAAVLVVAASRLHATGATDAARPPAPDRRERGVS